MQVTRIVHDLYDHDPKRGFYGGGGLDGRIGPMPLAWALFAPPPDRQWGVDFKSLLDGVAARDDRRRRTARRCRWRSNMVDLDPELKDAWGMPALRVTYRDHPDDLAFARFLQDRSVEIMQAAGALEVWKDPVTETIGGPHLLGHRPHGQRPGDLGGRQVPPHARHPEPVPVRRVEHGHVGARSADDDDPGARVPRGRAHRALRQGGEV